jgi:hypothetical protein
MSDTITASIYVGERNLPLPWDPNAKAKDTGHGGSLSIEIHRTWLTMVYYPGPDAPEGDQGRVIEVECPSAVSLPRHLLPGKEDWKLPWRPVTDPRPVVTYTDLYGLWTRLADLISDPPTAWGSHLDRVIPAPSEQS